MSKTSKAYKQGYNSGLKQGSAVRVSVIWEQAYNLGYAYDSKEFNDYLAGYAEGYAHDLTVKELKNLRGE